MIRTATHVQSQKTEWAELSVYNRICACCRARWTKKTDTVKHIEVEACEDCRRAGYNPFKAASGEWSHKRIIKPGRRNKPRATKEVFGSDLVCG